MDRANLEFIVDSFWQTLPFLQEFEKFTKFANSLLTRSTKLTDLVQAIESEISHIKDKGDDAPDNVRAKK